MFIDILAISLFFLTPVMIISIIFRHDARQKARIHKERMFALTKGTELPPYDDSKTRPFHIRARNAGISLIACGIGVFIALYFTVGLKVSLISLFLVILGLGQLLISYFSKKDLEKESK